MPPCGRNGASPMSNLQARRTATYSECGIAGLLFLLSLGNAQAQVFLETRYPGAAPASPATPPGTSPAGSQPPQAAPHPYLAVIGAPPIGRGAGNDNSSRKAESVAGTPDPSRPRPVHAPTHDRAKDVMLAPAVPPAAGAVEAITVRSTPGAPAQAMAPSGTTAAQPTGTLPPSTAAYSQK